MKHVVLYFGSFNPVHRGHIALAEWVAEHVGCDEVVLVVSPKNPLKADDSLAPELNRFEMAELACARSRFPERIKPSVIEFLLEKPSYTIDTLRYLSRNYGGQMRFSVLLGADLVPQLERWRDYREILDGYPLLVYPRRGFETTQYLDRITLLNEAPLCDFSSTEVRRALEQGDDASAMLTPEVLAYIREKHPELVPLYEEIYNRRRTDYWQALEQQMAAYAAANGLPYRVNDLPYGRSEKGQPVVVNYFYHEKIRFNNRSSER